MATGNGELMHERPTKHPRMATARTKQDNETDEEGNKRGASMEKCNAGTSDGPPHPNQNTKNNKDNMVIFHKKWKKYN